MWNTYNPMVDAVKNYGGLDEQDYESPYFEWDDLLEERYKQEEQEEDDEWLTY